MAPSLIMGRASAHDAQNAAGTSGCTPQAPSTHAHGKLATCAETRSVQTVKVQEVLHLPICLHRALPRELGGIVRAVWFALGLAVRSSNCQAHCKSGDGRDLRSSSILRLVLCLTHSIEPIGVPDKVIPACCHISGPYSSTPSGTVRDLFPCSGLLLVQMDACIPDEGIRRGDCADDGHDLVGKPSRSSKNAHSCSPGRRGHFLQRSLNASENRSKGSPVHHLQLESPSADIPRRR